MAVRKPAGPTSHDVVDTVRQALEVERVGHLGTLDPFAEGVLVVVVGRATRLARFAEGWPKTYEGVMRLGTVTTTDDGTGEPLLRSEAWRALGEAEVAAVLGRFRGEIAQRPPTFSAVKIDGVRAYRRARRGEAVALAARPVTVTALALLEFAPPDVGFRATVSGGTYLRALARDVGEALGCGAHLTRLTRTAVGPLTLAEALAPEAVTPAALRPLETLVTDLARRELTAVERAAVRHGRALERGAADATEGAVALFHDGVLVAVAAVEGDALKPRIVVAET